MSDYFYAWQEYPRKTGMSGLFRVQTNHSGLAKTIRERKTSSECRIYNAKLYLFQIEFCNKKMDKRLGSSDWNKDLNELTDAQLQYCSNDVIYLHKIKDELYKMLVREKRLELYNNSIQFLKTRIKLDQSGFKEDIFEH